MSRLLLLRHGESAWNAEGRWQGHADPPLSARGEQEASQAAAALRGVGAIFSSDLRRARRTAELIAAALGIVLGESYRELRERDVGDWSGLTNAEIEAGEPGARAAGRTPFGWESDESLVARVLPVIEQLATTTVAEIAVVSHGGVLRAVEAHLGAVGPLAGADNLCGRWIEVVDDRLVLGARVRLVEAVNEFGVVDPR